MKMITVSSGSGHDNQLSTRIAAWSPPGWLELEATYDPATGAVEMVGKRWSLHVKYGSGMFGGEPTVKLVR